MGCLWLGQPLFDKLDADIAYAMMGINAVKGVEIGAGFGCVTQRGSEHGDELTPKALRRTTLVGFWGHVDRAGICVCPWPSNRPARFVCLASRLT